MENDRVWYIWTNNRGGYTVAQVAPSADFAFRVAGPMTMAEARAWMHNQGVPGW